MFYFVRFLIDLIYVAALYFGFITGQRIGMKYMFTDMYIAKLYCGFIGIAVVVFIYSKIKSTVIFFLKAIGLHSVATNTSGVEAFKSVMKRFDKVIGVAAATTIITEAVEDVKGAMVKDDSNVGTITKMFPVLENLPFSGVIDFVGSYYAKSFTYLDECILAYSFAMNKPILQSIKDAFLQFLKKSYKIIGKLIISNIVMTVINIFIAIVGIIFFIQRVHVSLYNIIIFYIVIRTIMYIIDDAFVEPFLLKSVIVEYVSGVPSAEDEFEKNFDKLNASAEDEAAPVDSNQDLEEAAESIGEAAGLSDELNALLQLPAVKRLMNMTSLNHRRKKYKEDAND